MRVSSGIPEQHCIGPHRSGHLPGIIVTLFWKVFESFWLNSFFCSLHDLRNTDESQPLHTNPSFLYKIEILQYKLHRLLGKGVATWVNIMLSPSSAAAVKWDCHQKRQLGAFSTWPPSSSPFTAFCLVPL